VSKDEDEDLSLVEPRYWKTWDEMSRTELIDSLFAPMTPAEVMHQQKSKAKKMK